ncbi:MAG: 50S ribosomal protein L11 [Alphaproteobacteria bacterium]|nr:MAG: 50S ribosomal protein L11 [Alphaproteobacteria bacterium]
MAAPKKGKKVAKVVSLQVPAGAANPSPPVGPALGQAGVAIMDFCNQFNGETKEMEKNTPCPVIISVYEDRSFTFVIKTPPASYYIKKLAKLPKGSSNPSKEVAGQIKMSQLKEIAELKMVDLSANDIDQAVKIIAGSARSMGVEVVEG